MCAALLAEWWRGEYSNSIVYVVIDETRSSLLGAEGRGGWFVAVFRQQLFVQARCFDVRTSVACLDASAVGGRSAGLADVMASCCYQA
jgi:hypothetical protein